METVLSVMLGEIAHRSISFLINKFCKEGEGLPSDEKLRRMLMRVHIVVEEAEGRHIRNPAMLQQLKVLSATMYRGYYVLDTLRYQEDNRRLGGTVSRHSFALSKSNPAKRIQLCGGTSSTEKELLASSLEITICDAREFVMFLSGCPPLCRRSRIYSTYLVMEKCMFGRHVEMEHILNFLMEKGSPPGTQSQSSGLDVLPIVGPMKAGKSTLVAHACNDERVRAGFSRIVFFTGDDLDLDLDLDQSRLRNGGTVKHQRRHAAGKQRLLLIVELDGDIEEATWSRLINSASETGTANGSSKIIICSRSDEIARFGTTRPLRVEYPTREAYWYFFKALAFGSTNPEEEPRLASMAMEIAESMNSSIIAANMMAHMLRTNFSAKFWSMAASWTKQVKRRDGWIFGGHPVSPWQNKKPVYVPRISNPNQYCWIFSDYQLVYAQDDEVQEITLQEVLLRDVVPHGNYDVLMWRSSIPPHSCCIFRCGVYNKAPKMSVQHEKRTHS